MRGRKYRKGDRYRLVGPSWPEDVRGRVLPIIWAPRHGRWGWVEGDWVLSPGDHEYAAVPVDD